MIPFGHREYDVVCAPARTPGRRTCCTNCHWKDLKQVVALVNVILHVMTQTNEYNPRDDTDGCCTPSDDIDRVGQNRI